MVSIALINMSQSARDSLTTFLLFIIGTLRNGAYAYAITKYFVVEQKRGWHSSSILESKRRKISNGIKSPKPNPLFSSSFNSDNDDNREELRFRFKGYTIWMEPEQFPVEIISKEDGVSVTTASDLDHIIATVSTEQGLQPIPKPHVTLLYGMSQFSSEEEVKAVFKGEFKDSISKMEIGDTIGSWSSPLKFYDELFGICFDGVDGEEMDMAWTEITYAKAPEYERMVDIVYQMFYKNQGSMQKWSPHLSLAYDNPEDTRLSSAVVPDLISRFPTLTKDRKIEAISLWDTNGRMSDWKCLDRIFLRNN